MFAYLKIVLRSIPWLIILILVIYVLLTQRNLFTIGTSSINISSDVILEKTEKIGRLEVSKYYFKEITEIRREGETYSILWMPVGKLPDKTAVLISSGEAAGCIDLQKLRADDIRIGTDTIWIDLPVPELCYFKIDLKKSRIYDLNTSYMGDKERKDLVEQLYKAAEEEIRKSALSDQLMFQTRENAILILEPILKTITGKEVQLSFPMTNSRLEFR